MNNNYIYQIKEILAESGMSQQELARELGVTFAALNRWINGHSVPQSRRIELISKFYKDLVGYPSITAQKLKSEIKKADGMRINKLPAVIAKNKKLQESLLLEHTYNSTAIEGTTFSKRETEFVIFEKVIVPNKSLVEHLEVTNHASVLIDILQNKYEKGISVAFIKKIHKELMQGIRDDVGEYAKHHRGIRGVEGITLTFPEDIESEMEYLVSSWNEKKNVKISDIAAFHSHFELIHPFTDGNGRIGRLLMIKQCLERNYPPVVIENKRKAEYYDVLEYSQKKSDGPFVLFLVNEMKKTYRILQKYLT